MAGYNNICKRAILNEIIIRTKRIASECKDLANELGIRDVRFCEVTKGEIRTAIRRHSTKTRREEIQASNKVGDRVSEDSKHNTYMT